MVHGVVPIVGPTVGTTPPLALALALVGVPIMAASTLYEPHSTVDLGLPSWQSARVDASPHTRQRCWVDPIHRGPGGRSEE